MNFNLSQNGSRKNKTNTFLWRRQQPGEFDYAMEDLEEVAEEDDLVEDVIFDWQAPEYVKREKSRKWYLTVSSILVAIIGYAILTNNPIMAITFVLIGVLGYIFLNKNPRILKFRITAQGVMAGKELYPFDNIESFWIFYEPPAIKFVSLKLKHGVFPHVHMPIHREDPTEIRKHLLQFAPEEKQQLTIVDAIENYLGI